MTSPRPLLVLMRHGSSSANEGKTFGGWEDAPLSERGVAQARAAGAEMQRAGLRFDVGYTSVLRRAAWTLWHCLDALDRCWLPVVSDWRLNERHYGALQGLPKDRLADQHGAQQVRLWRRAFRVRPPLLRAGDPQDSFGQPAYAGLTRDQVPLGESLQDTQVRVRACWDDAIAPALKAGKNVLVVAHGNSIRALLMSLERISEDDVVALEIPNGHPLLFEVLPCTGEVRRRSLESPPATA